MSLVPRETKRDELEQRLLAATVAGTISWESPNFGRSFVWKTKSGRVVLTRDRIETSGSAVNCVEVRLEDRAGVVEQEWQTTIALWHAVSAKHDLYVEQVIDGILENLDALVPKPSAPPINASDVYVGRGWRSLWPWAHRA